MKKGKPLLTEAFSPEAFRFMYLLVSLLGVCPPVAPVIEPYMKLLHVYALAVLIVDLAGERLIGAAIVSLGLPQVGPRQEQLRAHFEETRGSGFDYAYRFPGMNKVLQAAGRVIRTPEDKGVVLLIDDRFLAPDTRRLMPPHWDGLRAVDSVEELRAELEWFWNNK